MVGFDCNKDPDIAVGQYPRYPGEHPMNDQTINLSFCQYWPVAIEISVIRSSNWFVIKSQMMDIKHKEWITLIFVLIQLIYDLDHQMLIYPFLSWLIYDQITYISHPFPLMDIPSGSSWSHPVRAAGPVLIIALLGWSHSFWLLIHVKNLPLDLRFHQIAWWNLYKPPQPGITAVTCS